MPQIDASRADCNLLFGVLALQMDFIDREALVKAMSTWVNDKAKPLGHIFRDQGSLNQDELALLDALVAKHLQKHGNDPEKSLAAVNTVHTSLDQLHHLADADLDASLVHVSASRALENQPTCDDPFATRAGASAGSPSSTARYRILRPHAKGGLGQVSVALDEELHREVALKEIQNQHADNVENRARFLVEAEITGRLEHPGIVPVYGLGQYADGRPYYAMRFIRGDNLKEAVKRFHETKNPRRAPGERAIEFRKLLGRFLDVCNAMAFAHSRGVLHRDLKPGNIMLGEYGETLVVDWGLAKLLSEKVPPSQVKGQPLALASGSGSAETIAGSALGTPQFMSPEQAEGRLDLLGPTSDVYSLGATLYYLLTDKAPFEDPDVGTVLRKVASGDFPRPHQVKAGVPAPLEAVCLKAMALKPKDRYRSPRALANDLEHWLADEPVSAWKEPLTARAMRWARRHRTLVATAGAVLMAAVTALTISTILISREQAHTEVERKKAQDNFVMAKQLAEENRRRLVGIYVNNGVRQLDDGKMEHAVIWFAEALKLDADDPEKVAVHRLRLAAALQRCSKVVQMLWHDGAISYAEFSRDGQRAITASEDNTAQIWDASTGQPLGPKLKHQDTVRDASFSPDGRHVVTTSNDQTAVVWDAATGQPLFPPLKHEALVRRAAYSADGGRLVTVSQDKTARIWNAQTGAPVAKLLHGGFVYFAAFSADGRRVVTACADMDKTVHVWNTASGEPLTLLKNRDYVLSAAFSPDGAQIVTGAKNGAIVITKVSGAVNEIGPATDDKTLWFGGPLDRVSFTADGRRVLAVGSGGAQLFETATGKRIFPARAYWDNNPAFTPNGRYELSWSSNDPSARIRDGATGGPQSVALGKLEWASLQRGSTHLVVVGADQLVRVWDAATGKPLSPPLEGKSITRAWLSPNGQQVLGHDAFIARIWDARTGQPIAAPMQHASPIRFAAFSADGRRTVTASDDNSVRTWDPATGGVLGVFMDHKDLIEHAAFSPDGSIVISAGRDNTARLWNAATGKALAVPPLHHPSWVRYAAFSFDGKLVATVSSKLAKVWEVASGKAVVEFKHTGRVAEAAFSADGRRLLTVSDDTDDRTVRIWDVASGEAVTPPLEHKEILKHAWFSPDGLRVLTSTDRDARLWDATTGEPITPRLEHAHLLDVAFAPDGFGVITVGADGTVRSWDLPRDERPIEDMVRLAELVSGLRHDAVRGCEPCPPALLRENWARLREKYPDDFQCPPQTVSAWHRQEAEDAEHTGHWKEAILHLDELVKREPAQAALHVRRGKALVEVGERKKAIGDYHAAIKLNPDLTAAAITLANLLFLEGKQQEVEELFRPLLAGREEKVQDNPSIGDYRQDLAWTLESLAVLRQLGGRLADAEAAGLVRALALRAKLAEEHPKEPRHRASLASCHDKLGSILRQAKQSEAAEKAYRTSLTIRVKLVADFPVAESFDGLAWFLAVCPDERLRDPAKAVAAADKAMNLVPGAGNYWTTLGVAQYRTGAWKDAIASLDKAMALNVGGGHIDWLFLAMAHQQLGDQRQARRWYDKAVAAIEKEAAPPEHLVFRSEAADVLGLRPIP